MFCKRTTALAAAATLAFGSLTFAQVPDMKMAGEKMAGDMMGSMEADKTVNMQLAKFATMPEQSGDMAFTLKSGCSNSEEIELSKAVAAKATDPKVKELALSIQKDHEMAQEKLKPIAMKLGVTLPAELPTAKKAELTALNNMSPEKMQKAYLSIMKAGHLMVVSDMTDHMPMLKDADLKAWTAETLPHVRAHTADILKTNEMMGMPLDLKFESMPMDHSKM